MAYLEWLPTGSPRLKHAKELVEQGRLREADAVLKSDEIEAEVARLKEAKSGREEELRHLNQELAERSNELLVKAGLWRTFLSEPGWFEKANEHYEQAVDAARTPEALSQEGTPGDGRTAAAVRRRRELIAKASFFS